MKRIAASIAIGSAVALALFGLGYLSMDRGAVELSYALYWPAWLLQVLTPCVAADWAGGLVCENRALGKVLFYAALPLGAAVYALVAYGILGWRARQSS